MDWMWGCNRSSSTYCTVSVHTRFGDIPSRHNLYQSFQTPLQQSPATMSRPYRGRGRGRGNERFGYGRERRHAYEQEYARDREISDRAGFRRDEVRDYRRDGSRGPREGPRDWPREPPREPRPWESRDRPPPRDPRDRDPRDRDPRDHDPRERDPRERDSRERDARDSPREFRDRPPSGPRERHDSHSSNHSGRPPPREPRGEFHRPPERDKDSPSRPHGPKPSSGNGSRHNSSHHSSTPTTPVVGTPKTHTNQAYQEAHFYLGSETTVSRASEPYHIKTAQTEGIQKRLTELEAFNQALEILEAKKRKLEGEYASIETDVVREGVRAEVTGHALEVLNSQA
ncbi:transcriptional regulatory protein LGE1-domain-containing protein [Yarrowia lipolytica]|nr:transcriptional regulatory protein LGE1-domain-containing protein [Yarrowia lipolytica]